MWECIGHICRVGNAGRSDKKSFVNSGMPCDVADAVLKDCFNTGLTIVDGERE